MDGWSENREWSRTTNRAIGRAAKGKEEAKVKHITKVGGLGKKSVETVYKNGL